MRIYLIAPAPEFEENGVHVDRVLQTNPPATMIASSALVTVAGLLGKEFDLRLCDEVIDELDFDDPAEVICITMNVSQVRRGLQIAAQFRAAGKTIIVGGPHVSLAPELFAGVADCMVEGEFETVVNTFVADLRAGKLKTHYKGGKADLAQAVMPRWDLYSNDRALLGAVQTSRGCPFECSFCDVIAYLGRAQRHNPPELVVAELQNLYGHGYRSVFLSDDNFTVYRKRTRALLEAIIAWNGQQGRAPVALTTQMSIDVTRDPELMELCNQAGLRNAFVGVETDSETALAEVQKRQNLRQNRVEQISNIVSSGIAVEAGLMVGFDSDDLGCFERQFDFAMALPVPVTRVSVLSAPVATPLYAQLKADGRLLPEQDLNAGLIGMAMTNFYPAQMSREQLAEGARWLMHELLLPENIIKRLTHMARLLKPAPRHLQGNAPDGHIAVDKDFSLRLMRIVSRTPGGRQILEASVELSSARPEISSDIARALFGVLPPFIYHASKHSRSELSAYPSPRPDHGPQEMAFFSTIKNGQPRDGDTR